MLKVFNQSINHCSTTESSDALEQQLVDVQQEADELRVELLEVRETEKRDGWWRRSYGEKMLRRGNTWTEREVMEKRYLERRE